MKYEIPQWALTQAIEGLQELAQRKVIHFYPPKNTVGTVADRWYRCGQAQ